MALDELESSDPSPEPDHPLGWKLATHQAHANLEHWLAGSGLPNYSVIPLPHHALHLMGQA